MVNENDCNGLAITDLLCRDYPAIADSLIKNCRLNNIEVTVIKGANDYWCRDFMPLQVRNKKFIRFQFDPSYYKYPGYYQLKTDISNLSFYPAGNVQTCDIVLDGGTISYFNDRAIVTEKIFRDNPSYAKSKLIDTVVDLLELEDLTIIPICPYDITSHADFMLRFINKDTLLINDFSKISSKTFQNKLARVLKNYNLRILANDLHKNNIADDATGDYINMIVIQKIIFVPAYETKTDEVVHDIIAETFPNFTIIPMECKKLVAKAGALHCATWNY